MLLVTCAGALVAFGSLSKVSTMANGISMSLNDESSRLEPAARSVVPVAKSGSTNAAFKRPESSWFLNDLTDNLEAFAKRPIGSSVTHEHPRTPYGESHYHEPIIRRMSAHTSLPVESTVRA